MTQLTYMQFKQSQNASFRDIFVSQAMLVRVCSGVKVICDHNGKTNRIPSLGCAFLHKGTTLTIANEVEQDQPFLSDALIFPEHILQEAKQSFTRLNLSQNNGVASTVAPAPQGFHTAFDMVVLDTQTNAAPAQIQNHHILEVLLWLDALHIDPFYAQSKPLTERLRSVITQNLEAPWKAPDAAQALGMSEATLRRNLNKEGTNFLEQLRDLRTSFALMKLQTTDLPLAQIAYQSGFSSQSRLSEAFKSRFDISPSHIRENLQ